MITNIKIQWRGGGGGLLHCTSSSSPKIVGHNLGNHLIRCSMYIKKVAQISRQDKYMCNA